MKSLTIPFKFTSDGNVSSTSDIDKIVRQKITDVLMTTAGERVNRYGYGGNLKAFLFELNDPLVFADYKLDAVSALNDYVSPAQVLDLSVQTGDVLSYGTPEESTMTIFVKYRIPPFGLSVLNLFFSDPFLLTQDSIL